MTNDQLIRIHAGATVYVATGSPELVASFLAQGQEVVAQDEDGNECAVRIVNGVVLSYDECVIDALVEEAEEAAKERATCSECLGREYRGERCVCIDGGDAEDYDEALADERRKRGLDS